MKDYVYRETEKGAVFIQGSSLYWNLYNIANFKGFKRQIKKCSVQFPAGKADFASPF